MNSYRSLGKFDIIAKLLELVFDTITVLVNLVLGCIDFISFNSVPLGIALYDIFKTVATEILKILLTPFFGPLAWFIGFVIEVGIGFVDLKQKLTEAIDYILHQAWTFAKSFMSEINSVYA